jgi:hypothetical protein
MAALVFKMGALLLKQVSITGWDARERGEGGNDVFCVRSCWEVMQMGHPD